MKKTMTTIHPGTIFNDPRIAYEQGGFVSPLEYGEPCERWCVMRVQNDHVQLVPVSPEWIDDEKRDGCMMKPEPVITEDGHRCWLCTGYTIIRHIHEIVPPGYLPKVSCYAMSDGFSRALNKTLGLIVPKFDFPETNWHALYYLKGELWNRHTDGVWKSVTVKELIECIEEHSPALQNSISYPMILNSIQDWLQKQDPEKKAVELL